MKSANASKDSHTISSKNTEHIWAFDVGKASLGEAVRKGTNFVHAASLLMPHDLGEIQTAAKLRGIRRDKFLIHLKQCEWRFNHRRDNLYQLLLKSCLSNPL